MLPKPITIVTSESSPTCFVRPEEFSFSSSHAVTTQTPAQVAALSTSEPVPGVTSLITLSKCEKQDQNVSMQSCAVPLPSI